MIPLTEDGRPMSKCLGGWYDPDCDRCTHGFVCVEPGFCEVCECFLANEDTRREDEP